MLHLHILIFHLFWHFSNNSIPWKFIFRYTYLVAYDPTTIVYYRSHRFNLKFDNLITLTFIVKIDAGEAKLSKKKTSFRTIVNADATENAKANKLCWSLDKNHKPSSHPTFLRHSSFPIKYLKIFPSDRHKRFFTPTNQSRKKK